MYEIAELLIIGFLVGGVGTLIGAGGGFVLVPLLIFLHPDFTAEETTAISIAIVAANAISGSVAYARQRRIDYKAGLLFAACTIPGSILGVYATEYIPKAVFNFTFSILLISMALYLIFRKEKAAPDALPELTKKGWKHRLLVDKSGTRFSYAYNQAVGVLISVVVGFVSPILGIGGGIIHVPALVNWLRFPVSVATATSHFILACMASISVLVHVFNGGYADPLIQRMVIYMGLGALAGAQLGAVLSHNIHGNMIIRILAICLGLVGLRILFASL